MLILALMQLLFYFFITKVFPGNSEGPELPLQFLRKGSKKKNVDTSTIDDCLFQTDDDKQIAIKMMKVQKRFGKKFVLRNLSLDVYKNQITVLFGKN
jgi:uncharacterized ferredoxin-like protein